MFLVQTHEHGVVDLAQTKQTQGLLHLRRALVDTTNAHHDRQTALSLAEQMTVVVGISSLGNQIGLHLSVFLVVLLSALHHRLSLDLLGLLQVGSILLGGSLQLLITTLLQGNGFGAKQPLDTF